MIKLAENRVMKLRTVLLIVGLILSLTAITLSFTWFTWKLTVIVILLILSINIGRTLANDERYKRNIDERFRH